MAKFTKGESGNRKGRTKGAKNKIRYDVAQLMEEYNCKPFEILSKLANFGESEDIQFRASSTLAKYLAPQLKHVEHKTEEGSQFSVNISMATDKCVSG